MNFRTFASAALLALAAAPSFALAAGGVSIRNEVLQQVMVTNAKGESEQVWKPAGTIVPGSKLAVAIRYTNQGSVPADGVEIKNPLAPELAFTGSVSGDAALIDYSVDGGRSWGALERLSVPSTDGKSRPASAADVSAIRFRLPKALRPGEEGEVRFGATLR